MLRAYTFLDRLQPALASFLGTTSRGFLPVQGQAALLVEVAPGIAIHRLADVAIKANDVRPGLLVVERSFGLLEVHGDSQAEVRSAGESVLAALGCVETDRMTPRIHTSEIVTNVAPYHAQLLNSMRYGDMLLGGDTLYILEAEPAACIALAANEAEKASPVKLIQMQPFGAFGRLYLGGTESAIAVAAEAARSALEATRGR